MFRLIFRQILSHKLPLFLILLSWGLGAYFFTYHYHSFFAYLNHLFKDPASREQNPKKALQYVKSAQNRLVKAKVDLKLMEKSCDFIPFRYIGNAEQFYPHWIEKLEEWSLSPAFRNKESPSQSTNIVHYPEYWQENYLILFKSLKDITDALAFSYEVPTVTLQGKQQTKLIVIPRIFEQYANAICQKHIALLVWGDYVEFQEWRIKRTLEKAKREISMKQTLSELDGNPYYIHALHQYLGEERESLECQGELRLSCISSIEAIKSYQKLIIVSKKKLRPRLHLKLAQTYLMAANHISPSEKLAYARYEEKALNHLHIAAKSYITESEARLRLGNFWLKKGKYKEALKEASSLFLLLRKRPGFSSREFHSLVKKSLTGVGRLKDADCFASTPEKSTSKYFHHKWKRPYCTKIKL